MMLDTRQQPLQLLSDDALLRRLAELTTGSRRIEAELVAHIAEVDARRLYTREACGSMFTYCRERLHLSEAEALLRIAAARASRRYPVLLEMLRDGRLHLNAIARLAPHLTDENCQAVLGRAVHRSKREILELVAELSPQADVPESIRKLPERRPPSPPQRSVVHPEVPPTTATPDCASALPRPDSMPALPPPGTGAQLCPDRVVAVSPRLVPAPSHVPGSVLPIAPGRYRVQFTAGPELRDKLERLQALMRTTVRDGDLARVIDEAVTEKLARLEARKFGRTKRPRTSLDDTSTEPSSRHVPAAVRRTVHQRDGCQCAYRDDQGRRCSATVWLEYHHRRPYGYGGNHAVANVALLCKAHNEAMATLDFGSRPSSC